MSPEILKADALTTAAKEEICAFLDSQRTSHPAQYPQWSASGTLFALFRSGGEVRCVGSYSVLSALGRAVPFFRYLTINRGPVCDDLELLRSVNLELISSMRTQGYIAIDSSPDWPDPDGKIAQRIFDTEKWFPSRPGRVTLRLDLTKPLDTLFAAFRKNTRYEIRRAERMAVTVSPAGTDEEINEYLRLYVSTAERKQFMPDSREHLRHVVDWLRRETNRGALLLARVQGELIGGAIIVRAGTRCWYLWGASGKHDHVNAGYPLQWQALQWAKAHGCDEYDFGGYTIGATSGPAWFKEGFGGSVVKFMPTHRAVLRPGSYKAVRLLSKM